MKPGFLAAAAIILGALAGVAEAQEIPFRLAHNMILLPLEVNGVKTVGRLDTGGLYSFMDSATASELKLNPAGQASAGGVAGRMMRFNTTPPVTMKLGNLEVKSKDVMIIDPPSMAPGAENPIGMTLGMDIVRDLVVKIDFDRSMIEFLPVGALREAPQGKLVNIHRIDNDRSIIGAITGRKSVRIDFGTGVAELSEQVAQTALAGQPRSRFLAHGVDGAISLANSTVPMLAIAGVALTDVPVSIRGNHRDRIGIGMDILKRFNLTFDFSHDRMWMAPNAGLSAPFRRDRIGVETNSNTWPKTILMVAPGSPAERAGRKGRRDCLARYRQRRRKRRAPR